ncbi:MAG: hypothetical protein M3375_08975, partial [Actinomycetota bacterium]|nr:hypothetical protein [Actinomycetota bacterium]
MSWVVAPALMLAVILGCGLLVRRLGGDSVPGAFVAPLGFAVVLVVSGVATSFDATSGLGGFAFLALAVVGLVLERRTIVSCLRRPGAAAWAVAAAFVAFAVVAAPVVLTGSASYTGYARIVDLSHQFSLSAHLFSDGRAPVDAVDSSATLVVSKVLAAGYPGGWQGALASFGQLLGTDITWLYQPLLAVTSAMCALGLFGLLRGVIERPMARAIAAGAASQANLLYAYGVAGGFKELTAATLVVLTAGLCGALTRERALTARDAVALGTAVAACLAAFSLVILPWIGVVLGGAFVVTMRRRKRRRQALLAWAATGAVVIVASLPAFAQVSKLADVASRAQGPNQAAIADLGNLDEPVPIRAAAGTWLTKDYRVPQVTDQPLSDVLVVLVLVLAAVGLARAVRRRDLGLPLATAATCIALAYFATRTAPWFEFKAIAITGSLALACAFAGAAWLTSRPRSRPRLARVLGVVGPATLAVVVLTGNSLAYHNAALAPTDRLRELARIGERYAGQGPALHPSFEDVAEYFLRDSQTVGLVNQPQEKQLRVRAEAVETYATEDPSWTWDLDELQLEYVQSYPLLVLRRSPLQSRPPANYRLAERTRYYEVWRRTGSPRAVLAHLPGAAHKTRTSQMCRSFAALARKAAPGAEVAYAEAPEVSEWLIGAPERWPVTKTPGTLGVSGSGRAEARLQIHEPGAYDIWFGGSFGRPIQVLIDGKPFKTIANRRNYPEQLEPLGTQRLRAGGHVVEIVRGGPRLAPGTGADEGVPIGPVVAAKREPHAGVVRRAPLSRAGALCRSPRRLD